MSKIDREKFQNDIYRATEVRLGCLEAAVKTYGSPANDKQVLDLAKRYESYVWGGFAPIERPPTPMSNIHEAAIATWTFVTELAENTADQQEKEALLKTEGMWQRFIAELHAVLGKRFS